MPDTLSDTQSLTRSHDTAGSQVEMMAKLAIITNLGGSVDTKSFMYENGVMRFRFTLPDQQFQVYRDIRKMPVIA